MITKLEFENLGPAKEMNIDFGLRVNVITGDNGVGKTFLLDLIWFALACEWWPEPRPGEYERFSTKREVKRRVRPWPAYRDASLSFELCDGTRHEVVYRVSKLRWFWRPKPGPPPVPSILIYGKLNGAFSILDPLRSSWEDTDSEFPVRVKDSVPFSFEQNQVLHGLRREGTVACRGLIEDWETWRLKQSPEYRLLVDVLAKLSPGGRDGHFGPGEPVRLPEFGALDVPTVRMSYGDVPLYYASAGLLRILSLAYLIVWTWSEHNLAAAMAGVEPCRKIVLLLDEVEAHLHPQWQRTIMPSVVGVLQDLFQGPDGTGVQVITTTHAPLVLASMESYWSKETDRLINLELSPDGKDVMVEQVPWAKFGDASGWLTSPAFDLDSGYSLEAERAINAADFLIAGYLDELPENLKTKEEIQRELQRTLDGADPYWSMWLPYYQMDKTGGAEP